MNNKVLKPELFSRIILYLFVIFSWIYLAFLSNLAPSDYYKYVFFSEQLFSFDFSNLITPPLFPFLLGITGKIFSWISSIPDPCIFGGRLISLLSGLGILYFSMKIVKNEAGVYSPIVVSTILLFPFFLHYMSLPLTDVLFLFVFSAFLYFLLSEKAVYPLVFFFIGVLLRFEGVLLIIPLTVNYIKRKNSNIKILLISFSVLLSSAVFYTAISKRVQNKIEFIISNKSYLFFIMNPSKIVLLLYANFLFFLPKDIQFIYKVIILGVLLSITVYGYIYLYGINKKFALGLFLFKIAYIITKGYIPGAGNVSTSAVLTRRMLPVLFIFWLVFVFGLSALIKILRAKLKKENQILIVVLLFLLSVFYTFNSLKMITKVPVILLGLAFTISLFYGYKYGLKKSLAVPLVFLMIFLSIYSRAHYRTGLLINSNLDKAAFMISNWANLNLKENEKLVSYSKNFTIRYYTKNKFILSKPLINPKKGSKLSGDLLLYLNKIMNRRKIRYAVMDFSMNKIDWPVEVKIKKALHRERKSSKYFKLKKILRYKGRGVALIFKAVY